MKRIWGIRHIRWLYSTWRVHRWAARWGSVGIGLGIPAKSDMEILDLIWRGVI